MIRNTKAAVKFDELASDDLSTPTVLKGQFHPFTVTNSDYKRSYYTDISLSNNPR